MKISQTIKPKPPNPTILNEAGAFDLPSILTGAVVVGVLTVGVLGSIFGVIPFAQDNSAKQDLSAIKTAEGVAKTQRGSYVGKDALLALKLVSPLSTDTQVYADSAGFCAMTVSQTGRIYSVTSADTAIIDGNSCATAAAGEDPVVSDPWIIPDPALLAAVVKEVTSGTVTAPASYSIPAQGGTILASSTVPPVYQLTMRDAPRLKHLDASGLGVASLEGLQYAKNLAAFNISGNSVSDLTPLHGTVGLATLNVSSNPVSSLDPLTGINALVALNISGTTVTNLTPVKDLQIESLTMDDTKITDVSVMSGMPALLNVVANGTVVPDWSPANNVPTVIAPWIILDEPLRQGINNVQVVPGVQLTIIEARAMEGFAVTPSMRAGAADFTAFRVMTKAWISFSPDTQDEMNKVRLLPNLRELTLGGGVTDVSALKVMPGTNRLESFDGYQSAVTDLGPLAAATNLKTIKIPYMTRDISPLAVLTNVESLDLNFSSVTDLGPLTGMTKLKYLRVDPAVSDFSVLTGLRNLESIKFDYNPHMDSVASLAGLSKLTYLYVDYTPIATNWDHADWSPVAGVRYVTWRPANYPMPLSQQQTTEWVIPDVALRNAILAAAGKAPGDTLYLSDASSFWNLAVPSETTSLEGLQYAGKLDQLDISSTGVSDLGPLKGLALRSLSANGLSVADWTPVSYIQYVAGRPA